MKKLFYLAFLVVFIACSANKTKSIVIQPDGNKMAYLTKEFTVNAGEKVKIIMENTATVEVMKHNVVILNDESKINEVGTQALSSPGYLPNHPSIIAATPMADAGAKTEITFTAPTKPGKYVYICTYPGHYNLMRGVMIVK